MLYGSSMLFIGSTFCGKTWPLHPTHLTLRFFSLPLLEIYRNRGDKEERVGLSI